jgi:hypothetical protein
MRALAGMLEEESRALRTYEQAYAELEAAGFLEASELDTREKIATHRRRIDGLRKSNEALKEYFGKMESHLDRHLEAEGVGAEDRREFRRGFLAGARGKRRLLESIRALDDEFCDLMDEVLRLLESELGKWTTAGGLVTFESDAAVETYNELVAEIQKVADEQRDAQRELAGRILEGGR